MQYRIDPKTGNKLSVLGFGCMRFSRRLGSIEFIKAEELIVTAIEKGVNYFDTAYVYPESEVTLGKILSKNNLRDKVYIATKLPLIMCRTKADLDKYFNRQLQRLQTDHIDYYLLHMLSDMKTWNTLCEWGIEDWIKQKKFSGQIKQIGFSFHGAQKEFLKIIDAYDWEFVQIQYNYSDENFQAGVTGLKKSAAKDIPVIIMEPLLGGKLVNSLPPEVIAHFKKAKPHSTPVSWAFNWLWNQSEVTLLLSGMNDMKQLEENLQLADTAKPNMMSEKDIETIQEAKKIFSSSFKVHCTGCNYCMPCPYGVDIPSCFTAYNTFHAISKSQGALQYGMSTLLSQKPSLS